MLVLTCLAFLYNFDIFCQYIFFNIFIWPIYNFDFYFLPWSCHKVQGWWIHLNSRLCRRSHNPGRCGFHLRKVTFLAENCQNLVSLHIFLYSVDDSYRATAPLPLHSGRCNRLHLYRLLLPARFKSTTVVMRVIVTMFMMMVIMMVMMKMMAMVNEGDDDPPQDRPW